MNNSEFLRLNEIDYKSEPNKKRKPPIFLFALWILLTTAFVVTLYFIAATYNNEDQWKNVLSKSVNDVLQQLNVTTNKKFLKQFDDFLFKRRGTFNIQYSSDFIGWIVLTSLVGLSWSVVTIAVFSFYYTG